MTKNVPILDMLDFQKVPLKVLVVHGSPRSERRSRSSILMQEVITGLSEMEAVEITRYSFSNKRIAPVVSGANVEDIEKDDFREFSDRWLEADAVIWCAPVYHMGPPSLVRTALNRLSTELLETEQAEKQVKTPRYNKVVGAVVQGGSRYGGQEIMIMYLMQHTFQMGCIWVSADMPESYHAVSLHVTTDEALRKDQLAINLCRELARRVVETAKFVQAGLMLCQDALPDAYYPSGRKAWISQQYENE